ncbi:MAG TPA: hypothetical protein VK866_17225 [Acidimicrobiales bacterium]|nr:hypothetical protein [Acidimicrobiales bacterium]
MFSSLILGSGSFPQRRAHELVLAAAGWVGFVVALVAGWPTGLAVVALGYGAAAVSARRAPRAPEVPDEIDLRMERVLDRLADAPPRS